MKEVVHHIRTVPAQIVPMPDLNPRIAERREFPKFVRVGMRFDAMTPIREDTAEGHATAEAATREMIYEKFYGEVNRLLRRAAAILSSHGEVREAQRIEEHLNATKL